MNVTGNNNTCSSLKYGHHHTHLDKYRNNVKAGSDIADETLTVYQSKINVINKLTMTQLNNDYSCNNFPAKTE